MDKIDLGTTNIDAVVNLADRREDMVLVMITAPSTPEHRFALEQVVNSIGEIIKITKETLDEVNEERGVEAKLEYPKRFVGFIEDDPGSVLARILQAYIGDVTEQLEKVIPGFRAEEWGNRVDRIKKERAAENN